jgi:3-oxoacyl-[acyl-carrier-protein] synthase-3
MPEALAVGNASAPRPTPTLRGVSVLGCAAVLPPDEVLTSEIAERLGIEADWLVSRTGIHSRRYAADGVRTSDLASEAGAAALAKAGVDAADLDLVLVATMTADEITPNSAPVVAHALGATNAGTFDVGAACTAFLSALAVGAAWIESRRAERVLVIGADILSRITDTEDRGTAALFADGAGAVVLGANEQGEGLGPVLLRQDGSNAATIIATRERGLLEMDGPETFKHALARMTEITIEAAEAAGLALDEIDLFVYHQANQRITRSLGQRLELDPERVVDCIAEQGNTSAATLPLALAHAEADGRLKPGSRVMLVAFGAGFTWGGTVLTW